jgi:hypothetical protein
LAGGAGADDDAVVMFHWKDRRRHEGLVAEALGMERLGLLGGSDGCFRVNRRGGRGGYSWGRFAVTTGSRGGERRADCTGFFEAAQRVLRAARGVPFIRAEGAEFCTEPTGVDAAIREGTQMAACRRMGD